MNATKPSRSRNLLATIGRMSQRPMLVGLLLGAIVLVVFWPVTRCDFLNYDDPEYVTENPLVLRGLTPGGVVWAFATGHASNWHPLTWLSHMLDVSLFGAGPAGPHIVNLFFHAANAVLLFIFLRAITGAHWRSAFVAALFALHPLHVESVAWISERKDLLSTFFGLFALLAYGRHVRETSDQKRKFQIRLSLLFFVASLLSKPMLVTLPFVFLLLDFWPLDRFVPSQQPASAASRWRDFAALAREKISFFALSAASCAVTFFVQKNAGAVQSLENFSLGARLENVMVSYARYLSKTFWPVRLAVPYPQPGHWATSLVIFGVVLVAGLSAAAVLSRKKWPFAFTGWFWFLGTLVPVIGLVQVGNQSLADRYTYFPLIGIFIVLAWGTSAILDRWRLPKILPAAASAMILIACAARTIEQLHYWQNSGALFQHSIAVTENNYLAYDNLGFYLFTQGRLDDALDDYRRALRINPDDPNTLNNLGSALLRRRDYADAIAAYEAALRARPNFADAHNNLGVALDNTGRGAEAIQQYNAALRLDPDNPQAHNNLAKILFSQGSRDEAIKHFRRALDLNPHFTEALNNLGLALALTGNFDEAATCYEKLLRLQPDDAEAHLNLGRIFAAQKKWRDAATQYNEALRLKPDYAEAQQELAKANAEISK